MPALARFYPGMKPWDWEHLTWTEVRIYLEYMDAYIEAASPRGRSG